MPEFNGDMSEYSSGERGHLRSFLTDDLSDQFLEQLMEEETGILRQTAVAVIWQFRGGLSRRRRSVCGRKLRHLEAASG